MEVIHILSEIKLEPIEIKNEPEDLLVGVSGQTIAGGQNFKDPRESVLESSGIKTEVKSEPEDESVVEVTTQAFTGELKFKEESDNDSPEKTKKELQIQADNRSETIGFYALCGNESLSGESQSESEYVEVEPNWDWSTLYQTDNRTKLQKKDKPQLIEEVPWSAVLPSEYTILESQRVQCNLCPNSRSSIKHMRGHIRRSHRDKTRVYKCQYCPYTSKYGMSKHIIAMHKSFNELAYYECHHCGKRYKLKGQLITHLKSHKTTEELMQTNEIHKCQQCPKMFRIKYSLIKHIKDKHSNNKKETQYYNCPDCPYKCTTKVSMMYHIEKKHTALDQLNTLKCINCDFTTKFRVDLKRHSYKYHGQSYQCEKCAYQTKSPKKLNEHQMTHKNLQKEDKNYTCDKCDYRTYRLDSIKFHSRIHLKPEEIQYFYCYHCNFKFKSKQSLRYHIKRHSKQDEEEFKCYICDFKTNKRKYYIRHINAHDNN